VDINGSPVMTQEQSRRVIVQEAPERRPTNYIALSCCIFWLCNLLFGAIAFGYAMASSSAADYGDMKRARSNAKKSLYCNIAGVFVTIIVVIVIITVVNSDD